MIPGQNTYYNAGDAAKTVKINYAKENSTYFMKKLAKCPNNNRKILRFHLKILLTMIAKDLS